MFKNIFKPKWQHSDYTVRKTAVMGLSGDQEADAKIIEQLARYDSHEEVRKVAIERLENIGLLTDLLHKDSNLSDHIVTRITTLLCEENSKLSKAEKLSLLKDGSIPNLTVAVLQNSGDHELNTAALSQIQNQAVLAEVANSGKTAKLRQQAANEISDIAVMQTLLSSVKGKDKSVYRIIKTRLDSMREQEKVLQEEQAECQRLCEQAESLSRLQMDPLFPAKFNHLRQLWENLDSKHKETFSARFQAAMSISQKTLDHHEAEATEREQQGEMSRDAANELAEAQKVVDEAFEILKQNPCPSSGDFPALHGILTTQKVRWEEAASFLKPETAELSRFQKSIDQLQHALGASHRFNDSKEQLIALSEQTSELDPKDMKAIVSLTNELDKLLATIDWPSSLAIPLALQSAQVTLDQLSKFRGNLADQKKQTLKQIDDNVKALKQDIEEGKLKAGNKRLRDLQTMIKSVPMKDADRYQPEIRQLTKSLNELRDWQGFATTPKKEQLCQQMEALISCDKEPQELANEIKMLQDQWRELGQAKPAAEKQLWFRFKTAGDKAFEPCKAFFADQSVVRQQNLEKRQQLCKQLQDYIESVNWEGEVDWPAVLEILKTAKQEWRSYAPVERKANLVIQAEFDQHLKELQDQLDNNRERNGVAKSKLIEKMTELLDVEDLDAAIESAKKLQHEWKSIGYAHRKKDQKLWNAFRAAADKVFERRQQQREDEEAIRMGNHNKASAICEEVEKLSTLPDQELLASKGQLSHFKQVFEAVSPLPRSTAQQIKKRFDTACNRFITNLQEARTRAEGQLFENLLQKLEICLTLETSIVNNGLTEDLLSQIKEQWSGVGDIPEPAIISLNTRFDSAVDAYTDQEAERLCAEANTNAEKLRDLTLKLEIAAGIDSPAPDQQRRMELQVSRLSSSMQSGLADSGSSASPQEERRSLLQELCAIGPIDLETQGPLFKRFKNAYSGS